MSTLAGIPAERLLAAAKLPENAGSASDALRGAAGVQGHGTTSTGVREAQGHKCGSGTGKKRGEQNALEQRFAKEVLSVMILSGELVRFEYEAITLHVHGIGSKFTADFVGWEPSGRPVFYEVKGARHVHEASVLRVKAHAAARPWLRFVIFKHDAGGWRRHFDSGT